MTDILTIGFIAATIVFFYAFLIWHAVKQQGRSPSIYILLAAGNVAVALFVWNVISQPSNDPQGGMGLGFFLLVCAAISLALPFIAFLVFLFRLFNKK